MSAQDAGPGRTSTVTAITSTDLNNIAGIDGVLSVDPVVTVSPDYIQAGKGDQYVLSVSGDASGATLQLAAGSAPSKSASANELVVPESFVGVISSVLSRGFLSALPGLTLVAFDPLSIAVIVLVVMAIAFLAGTIPALRAAKADPIESLRYE